MAGFAPSHFNLPASSATYLLSGQETSLHRRIERCAVANVEREGINYRIEMKVPGARVVHVLRMPTAKEMQDHERASTSVVAARRSIETRAFLEPSGALYDKLHISHDGYAGAVPIVHQSAAVSEVIAQLAIEADEDPE